MANRKLNNQVLEAQAVVEQAIVDEKKPTKSFKLGERGRLSFWAPSKNSAGEETSACATLSKFIGTDANGNPQYRTVTMYSVDEMVLYGLALQKLSVTLNEMLGREDSISVEQLLNM